MNIDEIRTDTWKKLRQCKQVTSGLPRVLLRGGAIGGVISHNKCVADNFLNIFHFALKFLLFLHLNHFFDMTVLENKKFKP